MASAKMTLIGMNIFFLNMQDDLFANLTLPSGLTKQTLTDNILMRGGEFETLYANPSAMQSLIGIWSNRMQPTFTRWVNALAIEYAPLENYDRHEDFTDTTDEDTTAHQEGTGSSSSDGSVNTSTSDTSELKKSAFNESGYSPYEKTENEGTLGTATTDATDTSMENDGTSTLDRSFEHHGRIHGNIGVTTSQQMLEEELNLGYWNIYEKITELFLQEFTIPVYE